MNVLPILAQAAVDGAAGAPPQPSPLGTFGMLIPMFVIMYFLLIRPQQKRAKAHAKLVSELKTGDKVVTSSGIHGLVANVKEATIIVKIADNVKVEMDRAAVTSVTKGDAPAELPVKTS